MVQGGFGEGAKWIQDEFICSKKARKEPHEAQDGPKMDPSWPKMGPRMGSKEHHGTIWGPLGSVLGPSWGYLGRILGADAMILARSRERFGELTAKL